MIGRKGPELRGDLGYLSGLPGSFERPASGKKTQWNVSQSLSFDFLAYFRFRGHFGKTEPWKDPHSGTAGFPLESFSPESAAPGVRNPALQPCSQTSSFVMWSGAFPPLSLSFLTVKGIGTKLLLVLSFHYKLLTKWLQSHVKKNRKTNYRFNHCCHPSKSLLLVIFGLWA